MTDRFTSISRYLRSRRTQIRPQYVSELHAGIASRNTQLVGHVLDQSPMSAWVRDLRGWAAYDYAEHRDGGAWECMRLLLERSGVPEEYVRSAFSMAIRVQCDPKVLQRLAARVDLRAWDKQGLSALHTCVGYGRPALVQQLLDRGADPLALDLNHNTSFHLAALMNHAELLSVLDQPAGSLSTAFHHMNLGGWTVSDCLAVGTANTGEDQTAAAQCPVCLEEFGSDQGTVNQCGHRFCLGCQQAMAASTLPDVCPVCKKPFQQWIRVY